jgi:hypothetical protein
VADELDAWKRTVSSVPDEELLALQNADCLGLSSLALERWNALICVVEEEIRRRSLNDQPSVTEGGTTFKD